MVWLNVVEKVEERGFTRVVLLLWVVPSNISKVGL